MVNVYIVIYLSLCAGLNAALLEYSFEQILMGLASKFRSKCSNNGGSSAYSQLEVAILELDSCVPINFGQSDTICTAQRKKSYKCYEDFLDILENCLEPQEMYIRDILLVAHNKTFDDGCQNGGNVLLEKQKNFQKVKCSKSGQQIFAEYVRECAPRLSIVQNLYKRNDVITATDLCNDIKILTECDMKAKQYCNDDQDIQNFYNIIFNSYNYACEVSLNATTK